MGFQTILGGTAAMNKKIDCDDVLVSMYKMDDDEKMKLLKVISEKHFGGYESTEEIRQLEFETFKDLAMENRGNRKKTCGKMIEYMNFMENSERIEFLSYLFQNHFDSNIQDGVSRPTRAYIEGYLQRKLTDEEIVIMRLAYDWGHFIGEKSGMKQVLKSDVD